LDSRIPYPIAETQRLESLASYSILDTASETDYEAIVELISQITEAPMAGVSLVDRNRVWFKARKGMELIEIDRATSFCSHVILSDQLFVVEDAWLDDRFLKNKKVIDGPKIRFYAAMPLVTLDGYSLGALCIGDTKPRKLTEQQRIALVTLAGCVVSLLEYRKMQGIVRQLLEVMNASISV
jgi:GAF domain-containing protein